MNIHKKGELTTQQLVTIIILIISFGIILFLLFRLNLGETSDKEICHNSVVLKGKSSLAGTLDCKTNYVCISGGGECENFSSKETIEIDLSNEETAKNEIMKAIADKMADCWWMFGGGNVDYVGYSWKPDVLVGSHCAICSTIKFDDNIYSRYPTIAYNEFYEYLRDTKKDNLQTYLDYLYGVIYLDRVSFKLKDFSLAGDKIDLSQRYIIFTGMNGEGDYIPTYLVQSSEQTNCEYFDLTKA